MKKFYKENRVFCILMIVVLVCFFIILGLGLSYILKSSDTNVYGNRLDGISDVKITKKMKTNMEASVKEFEKISDVTVNVHGKIVYFDITFTDEASIDDAKNTSIKCLELFEEEYLNYYDIQFLIVNDRYLAEKNNKDESTESDNIFPIMGYRKAGATTIAWSHNAY